MCYLDLDSFPECGEAVRLNEGEAFSRHPNMQSSLPASRLAYSSAATTLQTHRGGHRVNTLADLHAKPCPLQTSERW